MAKVAKADKFLSNEADWDSGKLGNDEKYVKVASPEQDAAFDTALDLQMISIRLPKKMIEDLKMIAKAHGIGYQPLIRDQISRFCVHEMKEIIRNTLERRAHEELLMQEAEAKAEAEIKVNEEVACNQRRFG